MVSKRLVPSGLFAALALAGCNTCDCTFTPVRVWLVTPAGKPLATTQLELIPSRQDLVLEPPICGQTDPISGGCLQWNCTIQASSDSNDGAFVLVGRATSLDGTGLPVTVPLSIGNSGDACCGAVFDPADSTIVTGS